MLPGAELGSSVVPVSRVGLSVYGGTLARSSTLQKESSLCGDTEHNQMLSPAYSLKAGDRTPWSLPLRASHLFLQELEGNLAVD